MVMCALDSIFMAMKKGALGFSTLTNMSFYAFFVSTLEFKMFIMVHNRNKKRKKSNEGLDYVKLRFTDSYKINVKLKHE